MYLAPIKSNSSNINFQKFVKVKGSLDEVSEFRSQLRNDNRDFANFILKKKNNEADLYIFSGKDFNRLINIMSDKQDFFSIRHNIKKAMNKKPQVLTLEKAYKKLKNGKLF